MLGAASKAQVTGVHCTECDADKAGVDVSGPVGNAAAELSSEGHLQESSKTDELIWQPFEHTFATETPPASHR